MHAPDARLSDTAGHGARATVSCRSEEGSWNLAGYLRNNVTRRTLQANANALNTGYSEVKSLHFELQKRALA